VSLAADLASILEREPASAEPALVSRLAGEDHAPPVAELLEVGARARRERASRNELLLAIGSLLALHAPRASTVRH
jgi:hypothetical protein